MSAANEGSCPSAGSALCRFRLDENLNEMCGQPAAWLVSMPGRHKQPLCDTHILRYQADKSERGPTRVGRTRWDGQYVIEPNGKDETQDEAD